MRAALIEDIFDSQGSISQSWLLEDFYMGSISTSSDAPRPMEWHTFRQELIYSDLQFIFREHQLTRFAFGCF